jgi:hypothetical protein
VDDAYYYKIRSIEADLRWLAEEFKREGFSKVVEGESRRSAIRHLLADAKRHLEGMQALAGTEFKSEFDFGKI